MTKDDLIAIAEAHYKVRKEYGRHIEEPNFYRFPLPLPHHEGNAVVFIHNGIIKEIEVHYEDGSVQTVRPE